MSISTTFAHSLSFCFTAKIRLLRNRFQAEHIVNLEIGAALKKTQKKHEKNG